MTALRQRPLCRRLLGALLLALLLAQAAALLHAIAHGSRLATAIQGATAVERDAIWGHAAQSSPCLLVDQLLIGQANGTEPPALPPAPAGVSPPVRLPPAAIARRAPRVYEARGPPRG